MSKASVTKLSGVSIQVASFASTLDLPTSELVAVVSLNLGQSDRIADLRQVLEVDGLSTIITNESTLVIVSVQVDFDGLLFLRLHRSGAIANIWASSLNIVIGQPFFSPQIFGAGNIALPVVTIRQHVRCLNFVISSTQVLSHIRSPIIALVLVTFIERNGNYGCIFCKRCKRHAHNNHKSGRQQSQQTSFEVRFLHVNFSYSLKFI